MDSIDAELGGVARVFGPHEEGDAELGCQEGAAQFGLVEARVVAYRRIISACGRTASAGVARIERKGEFDARVPGSCSLPVSPNQLVVVDQDVVGVTVAM